MPNVIRFRQETATEETSDAALVALALIDRQAFGLLYDRYVDLIYRYCHGRLGDREDAEDATSLVFARALAALPTQRGPSVRSWLFTIAHNVVLNVRRDAAANHPLEAVIDIADASPALDDLAVKSEQRHSVASALTLLPEDQRHVVELRLAGMTGPEIALALGRSHDSVRTTQHRALARLRILLGIVPARKEDRNAS